MDILHDATGELYVGKSIEFTVSASDNVGVVSRSLIIDGVEIALDGSYKASFSFTTAGIHIIRATAVDASGNIGSKAISLFVMENLDVIPPQVSIAHNALSTIYTGQTVDFTVTASDNVGVVALELTVNGEKMVFDQDGKVQYTFKKAGSYTLIATARDEAGNIGTCVITLLVIDSLGPR